MRDSPWTVAAGIVAFVLCWVPLVAAANARPGNRHAMWTALAGFLLGFVGLLLIVVGNSSDPAEFDIDLVDVLPPAFADK